MTPTARQGVTAFGSRLRRLSERLDREVLAIYRAAGERFEPRWYAVFTTLRDHGPLTVGELSQCLGVTHAAVSQVRTALEREGLVRGEPDAQDARRQILSLTPLGRETAERLAPLWAAVADATSEMLAEHAPTLLSNLDALESALDQRGLPARVNASFNAESLDDDPE
jgi:DNA-binding MarR family transcriptional regulator